MGEDGGLLGVVAAEAQSEAHDAVDLPGPLGVAAAQRPTRVPLGQSFTDDTLSARTTAILNPTPRVTSALHVLDFSLFQLTWFKLIGRYQASVELDNDRFI